MGKFMFFNRENLILDDRNRLKTHNHMGFAHVTPLKATKALYHMAQQQQGLYADIGAAYGIDTIYLIKSGARVVAIDLDAHHLEILKEQLTPDEQLRLETRCQRFPQEVDLQENRYDGILLSRILIFLNADTFMQGLTQAYQGLKEGGKIFIITVSPFSQNWGPILPAFSAHKRNFAHQPFFVSNLWDLLPFTQSFLPPQIQLFDTTSLTYGLESVGFTVLECDYESHHGTQDVYAIAQKG